MVTPPDPEGIPTLMKWWGSNRQMILTAMLALV